MRCPVCANLNSRPYCQDDKRPYYQCRRCALIFVPDSHYLCAQDEKAQYDLHQNDPQDLAYRKFLSQLFDPLTRKVPPPATGLDYGSGPGPTLSVMLEEAGYDMQIYDVFFAPAPLVLEGRYDFISCTEVVEHLHHPGRVLTELFASLRPGGWLGIMTRLTTSRSAFIKGHYRVDPTHVCFFSRASFDYLAKQLGAGLEIIGDQVILLHKAQA